MKFSPDTHPLQDYSSHMSFDNSVKIAFIVSVFLHAFIFFTSPVFTKIFPKKIQKPLEINYYVIKKQAPVTVSKREIIEKVSIEGAEKVSGQPIEAQKEESPILKPKEKKVVKNPLPKQEMSKRALVPHADKASVIPPLPAGLEKMPAYLDYAKSVREKINWIANSKYRQSYLHGEVCLNFILLSDGSLVIAGIVDEKSTKNSRLRPIALRIIEEAAPFNSFPSDLEYKRLTFGVTISFE